MNHEPSSSSAHESSRDAQTTEPNNSRAHYSTYHFGGTTTLRTFDNQWGLDSRAWPGGWGSHEIIYLSHKAKKARSAQSSVNSAPCSHAVGCRWESLSSALLRFRVKLSRVVATALLEWVVTVGWGNDWGWELGDVGICERKLRTTGCWRFHVGRPVVDFKSALDLRRIE